MGRWGWAGFVLGVGFAGILGGCAADRTAQGPRPAALPPHRSPGPAEGGGAVAAINRGIGPREAIWHMRVALNVAALSCRDKSHRALASHYNQMLRTHRAVLADAYAGEEARFRDKYGGSWQQKQDSHLTSLYNFFANPAGARQFCATAMTVSTRVNGMDAAQLRDYSRDALAELEQPIMRGGKMARR